MFPLRYYSAYAEGNSWRAYMAELPIELRRPSRSEAELCGIAPLPKH